MRCEQCQSEDVKLTTGEHVYPRRPDLAHIKIWMCKQCRAYVGCRPGTAIALGTPAGYALRKLRSKCHAHFDPIWKEGRKSRTDCYKWLQKAMNLSEDDAHIGKFDTEKCNRLLDILEGERGVSVPLNATPEMEEAVRYVLTALKTPGVTYADVLKQYNWAYDDAARSLLPEWFTEIAGQVPNEHINKADQASLIYGIMVRSHLQSIKAE